MISKKVKRFCCEDISKIENYKQALEDKDTIWVCHHKLEIGDGYTNSVKDMLMMNLYYNRPACELIFLKPNEHTKIHNLNSSSCGRNFKNSEVQKQNQKRAWCKKRGIITDDPIRFYDEHHNEKFKIVYGKQQDVSGKNNPMYGKNAWEIACSRKTNEQIKATLKSKSEKMKAWWKNKRKENTPNGH